MDFPFVDFHSHFISSNTFYCTARPMQALEQENQVNQAKNKQKEKPLIHFEGLLPQFWDERQLEKLKKLLGNSVIQLGEVGIDRRFENIVPLKTQFENLVNFLLYAKDTGKKVTIHSVKATELTIRAIKEAKSEPFSIIWHSFNGSVETAALLYKMGVFVSLSPRFHGLSIKGPSSNGASTTGFCSNGALQAITKANPLWALETDYEGNDKNEYNLILETHYNNTAKILGIDVENLKEHCYGQAQTFTNKPVFGR